MRIATDINGALIDVPECGMRRRFGQPAPIGSPTLPTAVDVLGALDTQHDSALADYDPFDFTSFGLRNRLERPPHCS